MPPISEFFGIVVTMYYNDHAPPHFHARYAEHEAQLEIDSLEVLHGSLPPPQLALRRTDMIRVRTVEPLAGFNLRVGFTDGTVRVIDVERYLRGPVFEPIRRDRAVFEAVAVDEELGVIGWPNGADIDPDVLYGLHEPAWASHDSDTHG